MSYNSELQTNNINLQALLDAVNALPEASSGIELPTLDESVKGSANDLALGKKLYDDDGNVIEGTVGVIDTPQTLDELYPLWNAEKGALRTGFNATDGRLILNKGVDVWLDIAGSTLGDAAPEDVVSGKTFTSSNGLKVTGTYEGSGGLPTGISVLSAGTIIPPNNTAYLDVYHNLDVAPNFILWFLEDDLGTTGVANIATDGATTVKNVRMSTTSSTVYNIHYIAHGYNSSTAYGYISGKYSNNTDMTDTIAKMRASSAYYFRAGYKYHWICGVMDNVM